MPTLSSPPHKKHAVAVLGAGSVGMAMAGYLALRGFSVRLYNAYPTEIEEITQTRTIHLEGAIAGAAMIEVATSNPAEALEGVSVAVLTVPAFAQEDALHALLPHLTGLRYLLLHPGVIGAALVVDDLVRRECPDADVIFAEAATSLFSCRRQDGARVHVRQVKRHVQVAALPASRTPGLVEELADLFERRFIPASSILETGMNNINPVYHCPPMIANYGRVEQGEQMAFSDSVTPGIARVISLLDNERLVLAGALGVEALSFAEFMQQSYGAESDELLVMIRKAYSRGGGSPLPTDPGHRFLTEDIPFAMVPWVSLAERVGVAMPVTCAVIELAGALGRRDWWTEGRNLAAFAPTVEQLKQRIFGELA